MTGTPAAVPRAARAGAAPARLVVLTDADRARLDEMVAGSPLAHYKQVWAWGDVLAYDGTRAIRLGVERDGVLCAAMTMYARRLPKTPYTFLAAARGPVLEAGDSDALACLVDGARRVAREQRAIFLRVDPEAPEHDAALRATLLGGGFVHLADKKWSDLSDPRIVVHMDLAPEEDDLFRAFRETHRRHVRGLARKGLTLREAKSVEDVLALRGLMTEVGERRGFPVRAPEYYAALWTHFLAPGRGALILAEQDGSVVAGFLALVVGAKGWLLYTGLRDDARKLHPNEAVWWEALRWCRRHGARAFNFGGSGTDWPPQPADHGYSILVFKQGFGADAALLTGYYDLAFKPMLYRAFRAAEEHVLPRVAASPRLGRLLRG